jgi:hypothetical protein
MFLFKKLPYEINEMIYDYVCIEKIVVKYKSNTIKFLQNHSRLKQHYLTIFKQLMNPDNNIMDMASEYGYIDVVTWLHNRNEGCTTDAMDYSSRNGKLEIVKFLHYNRNEGCTTKAMNWASAYGKLYIVKFLHKNRDEGCTATAMDHASKNGRRTIVTFLQDNFN